MKIENNSSLQTTQNLQINTSVPKTNSPQALPDLQTQTLQSPQNLTQDTYKLRNSFRADYFRIQAEKYTEEINRRMESLAEQQLREVALKQVNESLQKIRDNFDSGISFFNEKIQKEMDNIQNVAENTTFNNKPVANDFTPENLKINDLSTNGNDKLEKAASTINQAVDNIQKVIKNNISELGQVLNERNVEVIQAFSPPIADSVALTSENVSQTVSETARAITRIEPQSLIESVSSRGLI